MDLHRIGWSTRRRKKGARLNMDSLCRCLTYASGQSRHDKGENPIARQCQRTSADDKHMGTLLPCDGVSLGNRQHPTFIDAQLSIIQERASFQGIAFVFILPTYGHLVPRNLESAELRNLIVSQIPMSSEPKGAFVDTVSEGRAGPIEHQGSANMPGLSMGSIVGQVYKAASLFCFFFLANTGVQKLGPRARC